MIMYLDKTTSERTNNAKTALQWHNRGHILEIHKLNEKEKRVDISTLHGKPQHEKIKLDENRNHCKAIAEDLEKYVDGVMYTCPDCGNVFEMPETVGDKYKCSCCGLIETVEEYNQLSLYDYFIDTYDIEYRIGSDRQLRNVCIMVACGGPNIYIDTATKNVELYWWTERANYPLLSNTVEAINEWAEELYNL